MELARRPSARMSTLSSCALPFSFVDVRLQLSDGLGDCGAAGSTEDLLNGVSHGVVGGVHAASCVAFGGAHEVIERMV